MFVLMDMEWIENKMHYFCPTQVSAMRVDNRWNRIDCYDALIQPYDASCKRWKHIAYSGAEPEAFLSADGGPWVFLNLYKWLRDDDILCWWSEQPALVFQNVISHLLHRDVDHLMRVIYPAWIMDTTDRHSKIGSPYQLARERGIRVPRVEHSSANDTEAIRALLHGTRTSPSAILGSVISPTAKAMTQLGFRTERARIYDKAQTLARYKLLYDADRKLLHKADCPDVNGGAGILFGFSTYKSCIQKGLKPCRCCRDEYWEENWRLVQEIIQKCKYNYVYQRKGKLFHRTTCIHVRRIPFHDLRGGIYYGNCLQNGLKPCGWCKPTIKQQIDPPHVHRQDSDRKDCQPNEDTSSTWLKTRKLTRAEKVALHRHEAARKERAAFEKNQTRKTQAERQDEHTLTQTRYAFWAAVGFQTFHLRNCKKLDHISGLRGYAKYHDAIRAGLTPCKLCKPSPKNDIIVSVPIYHRERQGESVETLDRLCDAQGYRHRFETPNYDIETAVGKWRLDTRTYPVDVYHINLVTSPKESTYHKQPRLFLSLADTFEYIRRHDSSLAQKVREKASDPNEFEEQHLPTMKREDTETMTESHDDAMTTDIAGERSLRRPI